MRAVIGDLTGGATAAIVALPLALAFGVASGLGPLAGLYGAIACGLFAALCGGTRVQVSGPTGPMTVVVALAVVEFAEAPMAVFATIALAGVLQIGFGVLRLGQYIKLMPQPVISGFLSGVGLVIILQQLAPLLGAAGEGGSNLERLLALPGQLLDAQIGALTVGGAALVVLFLTPERIARVLPPALLALAAGTALASTLFPEIATIGAIPSGLPSPALPTAPIAELDRVIEFALILAFLGAIDSLLTSLVADSITGTRHDPDRELVGQGIGNLAAGCIGGLAGAGATMRTLVNVRAGGRTRLSGAAHALVLLLIVVAFADLAASIPLAVLAGVLVKVGYDIVDWSTLARLRTAPRGAAAVMLTTLAITVFVDLMTAVAVGFVMTSILVVTQAARVQLDAVRLGRASDAGADLSEEERALVARTGDRVLFFVVEGPLSFGSARDIARLVEARIDHDVLIVDLSSLPFLDSTAADTLEHTVRRIEEAGGGVLCFGLRPEPRRMLEATGALARIGQARFLSTRLAALQAAGERRTESAQG